MNTFKKLATLFAFSVLVLGLPTLASAQWRDRDRDRDDDDYRTNRRNDDDYRNNRGYNRNLQATIKNLKNGSKAFAKRVDREFDRNDRWDNGRWGGNNNRYDRRQLQRLADDFKEAADELDDSYDNNRDYNRSEDEARRVLQLGRQLDDMIYRSRVNGNLENEWSRIRQDLNNLANAYRYGNNNRNRNGNGNWGDWKNRLPWPF